MSNLGLVCVSGAAGFIGSHVISVLLARGYRVRGTVRSLAKEKDFAHLWRLPGADERLELFEADLGKDGAFDLALAGGAGTRAMSLRSKGWLGGNPAGADYALHLASPFTMDVKDPQRDLVDPAVNGTRTFLESARKSGTVKRVVLTSSMAAITDEPESDHVLTEADWNTKSSLDRNPYYYSKTLAERAGWEFIETAKPAFDLVVLNPFIVLGPSLSVNVNASNQLLVDLVSGVYPGVMNLTWGFVDVRDVAEAHVRAMENPAAKGRYMCAADTIPMRDVVELLTKNGYANSKLPKLSMDCAVGDFAVRLSSYLQPKGIGSYLRTHVGRVPRYDNSKIQRELGIQLRPVTTSILETMANLAEWGHVKPDAAQAAGPVPARS